MFNLSRTVQYGLRGLRHLALRADRSLVKIDQIARSEHIPAHYLRKIFQLLIRQHVLESAVGPGGGVRLSPGAANVSLARVVEIIDGKPDSGECSLFGYSACPALARCPLQRECSLVKDQLWDKLRRFTLRDMRRLEPEYVPGDGIDSRT